MSNKNKKENKALEELIQKLEIANTNKPESRKTIEHKFWNTQPVPQNKFEMSGNCEIEKDKEDIRVEPMVLPSPYYWSEVRATNPTELEEMYCLLSEHYVEDSESMFRFDYPSDFLNWALLPPGWRKEFHVGVRVAPSHKLVAFISAIPMTASISGTIKRMVEINFLCIHKKLRNKRLSPVLIKEITRRIHLVGKLFQAVYTTGIQLPHPLAVCQYYHRPLAPKKLVECGFCSLPFGMTMDRFVKKYRLKGPSISNDHANLFRYHPGMREMKTEDVPKVRVLLNRFLSRYAFHAVFESDEEVSHWFLPRKDLMYSYVIDKMDGSLSAFVSFYCLPSKVLLDSKHRTIRASYLFYYAVERGDDSNEQDVQQRLISLIKAVLLLTKDLSFDVFNCIDAMENASFIEPLKFGAGDGRLRYYLFNWRTLPLLPKDIAFLML